MKLNKKKVFVSALAVSLIAILSMGTIAWFSDSDEVTNEFKVATSTEDPDDIFSVDVWQKVDTDEDGELDATLKENGYTYTTILPGDKLVKEPIVVNTGSYDEYIRVKVTIDNADAWKKILGEGYDLASIFAGHDESQWVRDAITLDGDKLTYVYYYNGILEPLKESDANRATLFTHVVIPTELTQDDVAKISQGTFKLDIKAEAVQTENVNGDINNDGTPDPTAEAAKAAFTTVGM